MAYIAFSLFFVVTGTGAYSQLPGIQYLLFLAFLFVLVLVRTRVERFILPVIEARRLYGAVAIGAFYLLANALTGGSMRTSLTPLLVLCCFLTCFGFVGATLAAGADPRRETQRLSLVLLVILTGALAGQYLQAFDLLRILDADQLKIEHGRFARYGGFLNANITNSIAIMLLYGIYRIAIRNRTILMPIVGTILCGAIVITTQSRSGPLFMAPVVAWFLLVQLRRNTTSLLLFAAVAVVVAAVAATQYGRVQAGSGEFDPFGGLLERSQRDLGGDPRAFLLIKALEEAARHPILGNGVDHLDDLVGQGAHNMVMDGLVEYGIFGLAILIAGSVLLFRGHSTSLYLFCILKPVLFSHTFYDQVPIQLVLGGICALDVFLARRAGTPVSARTHVADRHDVPRMTVQS